MQIWNDDIVKGTNKYTKYTSKCGKKSRIVGGGGLLKFGLC